MFKLYLLKVFEFFSSMIKISWNFFKKVSTYFNEHPEKLILLQKFICSFCILIIKILRLFCTILKIFSSFLKPFLNINYDYDVKKAVRNISRKIDQIMSRQILLSALGILLLGFFFIFFYYMLKTGIDLKEELSLVSGLFYRLDEIKGLRGLDPSINMIDYIWGDQGRLINYTIALKHGIKHTNLILDYNLLYIDIRYLVKNINFCWILFERGIPCLMDQVFIFKSLNILVIDVENYLNLVYVDILKSGSSSVSSSTQLKYFFYYIFKISGIVLNCMNILFLYLLCLVGLHLFLGVYGIFKDYIEKNIPGLILEEEIVVVIIIIILLICLL